MLLSDHKKLFSSTEFFNKPKNLNEPTEWVFRFLFNFELETALKQSKHFIANKVWSCFTSMQTKLVERTLKHPIILLSVWVESCASTLPTTRAGVSVSSEYQFLSLSVNLWYRTLCTKTQRAHIFQKVSL